MTESLKFDIISSIVQMGYYWMGEQNSNAVESIIGLLRQIELNGQMQKKVDDLEHDYKSFFHLQADAAIESLIDIPEGKDEEQKLLWLSGVCIMNIFKVGDFEMAYTMLMQMSLNWNDLYRSVIGTLQKHTEIKNELAQWLMTHFFMACDLLGEDEINMMGFTVKKKED